MELQLAKMEHEALNEIFPGLEDMSDSGAWRLSDSLPVLRCCFGSLGLWHQIIEEKPIDFVFNSDEVRFTLKWNPDNGIFRYRIYRYDREDFQITFFLPDTMSDVSVLSVFRRFNPTMETDKHIKAGFTLLEAHLGRRTI